MLGVLSHREFQSDWSYFCTGSNPRVNNILLHTVNSEFKHIKLYICVIFSYVNNVSTNHASKTINAPLGAAIFGLGRAGSIHLSSLINNPRVTLKYVVDDRVDKFADLKKYWNLSNDVIFIQSKDVQRVYDDKRFEVTNTNIFALYYNYT